MKRILTRFALTLVAIVLFGQGCFGGTKQSTKGPDGGVWKSPDRGQTWVQKKAYRQGARVTATAANPSIVALALDPQDSNTVYAATAENGLLFSLDGGDSWEHFSKASGQAAPPLSTGRINAVVVDAKDKCRIYAARANEVYRTENCGRDWIGIFFGPRPDKQFTQLAVDWFNSTVLYAGTSEGDILKSTDSGATWQTLTRVEDTRITQMIIDPRDSRTVFAGTNGDGIWRTQDAGLTWQQIRKQFGEELRDSSRVIQLALDPKNQGTYYVMSKYGIVKTEDQGESWKGLNLTTSPGSVKINAMAVDPNDGKKIYYATENSFASTQDGGVSWTVKKLPTTRQGSALLIDPQNSNNIYLGTFFVKK